MVAKARGSFCRLSTSTCTWGLPGLAPEPSTQFDLFLNRHRQQWETSEPGGLTIDDSQGKCEDSVLVDEPMTQVRLPRSALLEG